MKAMYSGLWVKNYTTAHVKLREPVYTGCENKVYFKQEMAC